MHPHAEKQPMNRDTHEIRIDVEDMLDRLRPALIADGGNVELVDVAADGTVQIALQGACATCPAQAATLRVGIEEPLCEAVPAVIAVVTI
jgi:Fe-S cluster biogenesis protein NfuA